MRWFPDTDLWYSVAGEVNLDEVGPTETLIHLTANRAKNPMKAPPSRYSRTSWVGLAIIDLKNKRLWKKLCSLISNCLSLASGLRYLPRGLKNDIDDLSMELYVNKYILQTVKVCRLECIWKLVESCRDVLKVIYGYFVHLFLSKLLYRCGNVFIRVFCFHL